MRSSRLVGLIGLLCSIVAGCAGDDGAQTPADDVPTIPACARPGTSIPRPAQLPADLPLPPGTVFTSSETPYQSQLLVKGVIPTDTAGARKFFTEKLPASGYRLGRGDAEPPLEAESLFGGKGIRGAWRVNSIPNCADAVTLTLTVIDQP